MSLQGKTDDQICQMQNLLKSKVAELGGNAGNRRLMRELGWPEEDYWSVRDRLVDQGFLRLYRAYGGAVALVPQESQEELVTSGVGDQESQQPDFSQVREVERDLYEPVAAVLRDAWARHNRFRHHVVEITASQGRRNTGGTWSRPDIAVAAMRVFPFLPGKYFDLITFEVKPKWAINVTGVYEALAHRRAGTQSYLWLHCPDPLVNTDSIAKIEEEAERHGIGLILASDPGNHETWIQKCDPQRVEPDPEALNEFITLQLSDGAKDELAAWVR